MYIIDGQTRWSRGFASHPHQKHSPTHIHTLETKHPPRDGPPRACRRRRRRPRLRGCSRGGTISVGVVIVVVGVGVGGVCLPPRIVGCARMYEGKKKGFRTRTRAHAPGRGGGRWRPSRVSPCTVPGRGSRPPTWCLVLLVLGRGEASYGPPGGVGGCRVGVVDRGRCGGGASRSDGPPCGWLAWLVVWRPRPSIRRACVHVGVCVGADVSVGRGRGVGRPSSLIRKRRGVLCVSCVCTPGVCIDRRPDQSID